MISGRKCSQQAPDHDCASCAFRVEIAPLLYRFPTLKSHTYCHAMCSVRWTISLLNAVLPRHLVSDHAKNKTGYSCVLINGCNAFNTQVCLQNIPLCFFFTHYRKFSLPLIVQNAMRMDRKWLYAFLTSALNEGSGRNHAPTALSIG